MRIAFLSLLLGVSIHGTAASQSTYVVDRLGRPGSHFTDLPAATVAAADGDMLILRADGGSFTAMTTSKALTIVGEAGGVATISTATAGLRVQGIAAGRDFTLRNCDILGSGAGTGAAIAINGALGRVHLQGVTVWNYNGSPGLELTACVGVTLRDCQFLGAPGLSARNATIALADARCLGNTAAPAPLLRPAFPGAQIQDSHVTACNTEFRGGLAVGVLPPAEAIRLFGSTLQATGIATVARISAGFYGSSGLTNPVPAVVGSTSLLRIDPAVVVEPRGGSQPYVGVTAVQAALPSLSVTGRNLFTVMVQVAPGAPAVTMVGLPSVPYAILGVDGRFWIDPNALLAVPGVLAGFSEASLPHGLTLVMQVASVRAGNFELTAPAAITSRL